MNHYLQITLHEIPWALGRFTLHEIRFTNCYAKQTQFAG